MTVTQASQKSINWLIWLKLALFSQYSVTCIHSVAKVRNLSVILYSSFKCLILFILPHKYCWTSLYSFSYAIVLVNLSFFSLYFVTASSLIFLISTSSPSSGLPKWFSNARMKSCTCPDQNSSMTYSQRVLFDNFYQGTHVLPDVVQSPSSTTSSPFFPQVPFFLIVWIICYSLSTTCLLVPCLNVSAAHVLSGMSSFPSTFPCWPPTKLTSQTHSISISQVWGPVLMLPPWCYPSSPPTNQGLFPYSTFTHLNYNSKCYDDCLSTKTVSSVWQIVISKFKPVYNPQPHWILMGLMACLSQKIKMHWKWSWASSQPKV